MGFSKTFKRKFLKIKEYFEKNEEVLSRNILISGANSGLGFALLNLLRHKNNILALTNKNQSNIRELNDKKIQILNINLELGEFSNEVKEKIINFRPNIVINSAAVFGPENQAVNDINFKEFEKILNVNVFSAIELIKLCLKAKSVEQIINISSEMGSISLNDQGDYYYYRLSKTLLNSFTRNLSIDLKSEINTYCIHPGSIKTKLNTGGILSPDYSARKIINISAKNKKKNNGKFIDINEKILDW